MPYHADILKLFMFMRLLYIIKHVDEYVYRLEDITIEWRENTDL